MLSNIDRLRSYDKLPSIPTDFWLIIIWKEKKNVRNNPVNLEINKVIVPHCECYGYIYSHLQIEKQRTQSKPKPNSLTEVMLASEFW